MATRLPTAARNAAANAVADQLDAGSGPGTVQIRTGTQPASANDAASGTLLATVTLNDPAFGDASNGVCTLDVDPELTATAVATGTAGWFRMLDSTGATVLDGSVTATSGGGQLELASTSISSGGTVTITSGSITQPAS